MYHPRLLLFLLFITTFHFVFVFQEELRAKEVKVLPNAQERFALLVGVEIYTDRNISSLEGPANDIIKMHDTLEKYAAFPRDNIIVLSTKNSNPVEKPTKNSILLAISKIKKSLDQNGLLLFMFSGHGISRGKKAYLLPSDAILTSDADLLEDTSLSVDLLRDRIADTGVKQVIILLDACRNDPEKSKTISADNFLSKNFQDGFDFDRLNKEIEASAVIYATGIGGRAYTNNKEELGYFTEAITKAMGGEAADGSGHVTLGGLVEYIQTKVPKWVARDHGKDQKPYSVISGYLAESLIVSAIPKSPHPQPPPALVPPPKIETSGPPVPTRLKSDFCNILSRLIESSLDGFNDMKGTTSSDRIGTYWALRDKSNDISGIGRAAFISDYKVKDTTVYVAEFAKQANDADADQLQRKVANQVALCINEDKFYREGEHCWRSSFRKSFLDTPVQFITHITAGNVVELLVYRSYNYPVSGRSSYCDLIGTYIPYYCWEKYNLLAK